MAVVGGILSYINGFHRPFTVTDIAISYPNKPDIVSLTVLILVSLLAPIVIIFLLSFIRLPFINYGFSRPPWSSVAWEAHVSILGLCAALAATLFITSGLKDMVGKPRPHLLAVCEPDLSNISRFMVGGYGTSLQSEEEALVTSSICKQPDRRTLNDGFASFPSGHSSISTAGMVYLTLWLCARFSLSIPVLGSLPASLATKENQIQKARVLVSAQRTQAARPLWQFAFALFPIAVALFISSSRYADFHHHGVDIIAGMVIGALLAIASFKLYHLPIGRSMGLLTWGPRCTSKMNDIKVADIEAGSFRPDPGFEMTGIDSERRLGSRDGDSQEPVSSNEI